MKLALNPATQDAFIAIISSLGMSKIKRVFKQFIDDGKPLSIVDFALIMNVSQNKAQVLAQNRGELNTQNKLVGFLGFSLVPTNHQIKINNKIFYTWCAADTLIFPSIFGVKATITSSDPVNNNKIEIIVNNDILEMVTPESTMISWVDNINQNDIRCSMCNRVHFFASENTANKWHTNNQDTRIFTVTDFFTTNISIRNENL